MGCVMLNRVVDHGVMLGHMVLRYVMLGNDSGVMAGLVVAQCEVACGPLGGILG